MTLNERTAKFASLFVPIRSNPALSQRVQGYVFGRTGGKKLPDFLNNGSPEDVKMKLLDDLIEILESKAYDKLPACPSGQAAPTGDAGAPPALVPAAPVAVAPPTPPPPAPVARVFADAIAVCDSPAPGSLPAAVPPPQTAADPAATLFALIKQMIPAPAAPSAPSLTADQVRALVRTELASALEILASALKGSK